MEGLKFYSLSTLKTKQDKITLTQTKITENEKKFIQ